MYYIDSFGAQLIERRSILRDRVERQQQGPDVTLQTVLNMLHAARKSAMPIGFNLGLTELLLSHQWLFFEKPGEEVDFTHDFPSLRVLFGDQRSTFKSLARHIRSIPSYYAYEIVKLNAKPATGTFHIVEINDKSKKIVVDDKDYTIVVEPLTFAQVYPKLPENKGQVLPIFESFMIPKQIQGILPAQREEFFGPKR